jgi:hypothetical protein
MANLDKDGEALLSPMPTVIARSLLDDPRYVKCPRCWHMHSVKENYDSLCDRCCLVLIDAHQDHASVPHILANRAAQRVKYAPIVSPMQVQPLPVSSCQ